MLKATQSLMGILAALSEATLSSKFLGEGPGSVQAPKPHSPSTPASYVAMWPFSRVVWPSMAAAHLTYAGAGTSGDAEPGC